MCFTKNRFLSINPDIVNEFLFVKKKQRNFLCGEEDKIYKYPHELKEFFNCFICC